MSRSDARVLPHPARLSLIDEYSSVVSPVVHSVQRKSFLQLAIRAS